MKVNTFTIYIQHFSKAEILKKNLRTMSNLFLYKLRKTDWSFFTKALFQDVFLEALITKSSIHHSIFNDKKGAHGRFC